MAKFFCSVSNERGAEKHQIAQERLDINLFYGSREDSHLFIKLRLSLAENGDLELTMVDGEAMLNNKERTVVIASLNHTTVEPTLTKEEERWKARMRGGLRR